MATPAVGELVTTVDAVTGEILWCRVRDITPPGFEATITTQWRTERTQQRTGWILHRGANDEGRLWIRGEHAPDSLEAQALLAAAALVSERPSIMFATTMDLNSVLDWIKP